MKVVILTLLSGTDSISSYTGSTFFYSLHMNINRVKRNWSSSQISAQRANGRQHVDRWAGLWSRQSDPIMQGCSWLSAVDCISTISKLYLWNPGALSCRTALSRSLRCFPSGSLACPQGCLTFSRWFWLCGRVDRVCIYIFGPSSTRTVGGMNSMEGKNMGSLLVKLLRFEPVMMCR